MKMKESGPQGVRVPGGPPWIRQCSQWCLIYIKNIEALAPSSLRDQNFLDFLQNFGKI